MLVEQLSSLLDDTSVCEPWTLTGAEVRQLVAATQKARTGLDALLSRLAGAAESMGLPHDDGATSATAWLSNHTGIHKGEAAKLVGLSRVTTEHTEATRVAWATGQLPTDKAAVIMKTIDGLPDWVDDEPRRDAETHLIALAADHNLDDLKRLANRVLEVIDPDGADEALGKKLRDEEQRAWGATRMSLKKRGDGTTRGAFTIPDADADTLRAAIEGIIAPRRAAQAAASVGLAENLWADLPRDQKMGHAFTELINHLPKDALPTAGGLAATVAVTINIDDLRTGQGFATNTSGTDMSATKAQRIACNAHLVALYLDSDGRVLDHGMTRRLFDRHQRLALAVRDGGVRVERLRPPTSMVRSAPSELLVRRRPHRSGQRSVVLPLPPLFAPRRRMDRPHGTRRGRRSHPTHQSRPPTTTPKTRPIHPTTTPRRLTSQGRKAADRLIR